MIFKQVFDQKSSTYTYLIASSKGREALIIDPVIENVGEYIKLLNELIYFCEDNQVLLSQFLMTVDAIFF